MCSPATCRACGRTTWSGCGQHIDQVKARVKPSDWCTCTDEQKAAAKKPSLLQRFSGR